MEVAELSASRSLATQAVVAAPEEVSADEKKKKKKKKSHREFSEQSADTQSPPLSPSASVGSDRRVVLNVGGRRFETLSSTLAKYPSSLLGTMFHPRNLTMLKPDEKGEFFFDRNPSIFESILDFYRNGEWFPPPSVPKRQLNLELDFWRIDIEEKATKEAAASRSQNNLERLVALVCEHLLASADDPPRDIILSRKLVDSNDEDMLSISQFGWSFKRTKDSTARGVFGCKTVVDKALWAFSCAGKNQNLIVQRLRSQGIAVQVLPLPLPSCSLKRLPIIIRCNYMQTGGSKIPPLRR